MASRWPEVQPCFACHPHLLCWAGVALVAHRIRRPLIFDREENIAKLQVRGWTGGCKGLSGLGSCCPLAAEVTWCAMRRSMTRLLPECMAWNHCAGSSCTIS